MHANIPTWTTDRVEHLRKHFEDGLSCREIAAAIGVSRNAVIGKLTRLGLSRGPVLAQPRQPGPAKPRAARSVPRLQLQILRTVYDDAEPISDAPIESEHRCSLLELSERRCRWPINTPGAADFSFCGNEALDGAPYCTGHTRLAYKGSARPRMARA